MPHLVMEKVFLSRDGKSALEGIDLVVRRGEILCLLGPSGSGKTSLLRVVAGLETPSAGRILFEGRELAGTAPHLRRFGMMFQEFALFPHRNVYANVAFGLEVRKMPVGKARERVARMLTMVGLAGFEERRVDALSGGERQRVALARSLAPEPGLLLLDEPLGSLDRQLRERLAWQVRRILKSIGVTALFVTHDQAEAFTVADRVAVLEKGRIEQVDTPEGLYRRPGSAFVAKFLGFRNLVEARVAAPGFVETPLGGWAMDTGGAPAGAIRALVLRPESARLAAADGPPSKGDFPVVTATVLFCRFEGRAYHMGVLAGGERLFFDLANDTPPPAEGQTVRLELSPAAMSFLPEGTGNP